MACPIRIIRTPQMTLLANHPDAPFIRERLEKKRRKKMKGKPPPPALDDEEIREGVEALLSTTSARVKRRIAAARVRVGESSDHEAERDAEAEQEQREPRRPLGRR